jgi:hypothetical protein
MRDRSHDVNRNQEVQPESGYMTGVISSDRNGHTSGVVMYLHYKHVYQVIYDMKIH